MNNYKLKTKTEQRVHTYTFANQTSAPLTPSAETPEATHRKFNEGWQVVVGIGYVDDQES